ncbi:hypothetical protein AXF42_Ash015686 [Apostasia shenzhenica]|uniref:BRCT domain-containing protein n=1 Tax=Apostasia shenzhenica TaxID=1088818 RepID=A0A2H9ZU20_9ASPA|nr:hypothetical protein AXF42_Ash015686 [Apostasia shenzhenica]
MPDANSDPDKDSHSSAKRSLPSWMSSIDSRKKSQKRQNDVEASSHDQKESNTDNSSDADQNKLGFSKLLEGVVFVLSGFVNPERSTLRSNALEMGGDFRPDWTSDCTLLVCAFPNTPKFRQVQSDGGTIVSKDWISESYNKKKLIDIEPFLMHAGRPWRRYAKQIQPAIDQENSLSDGLHKKARKEPSVKLINDATSEFWQGGSFSYIDNRCPPSQIKKWVADDLNKTILWLERQNEKPESSEMRSIAAEGILTCLQDAVDFLKKNEDIKAVIEQWMFVPRVVKYLVGLEGGDLHDSPSKKELCELAIKCKMIYESELKRGVEPAEADFDSDETIEMTEEEIELACRQIGC